MQHMVRCEIKKHGVESVINYLPSELKPWIGTLVELDKAKAKVVELEERVRDLKSAFVTLRGSGEPVDFDLLKGIDSLKAENAKLRISSTFHFCISEGRIRQWPVEQCGHSCNGTNFDVLKYISKLEGKSDKQFLLIKEYQAAASLLVDDDATPDLLGKEILKLQNEVSALGDIVDKLPKTADGVAIVPGMIIWPQHMLDDELGARTHIGIVDLNIGDEHLDRDIKLETCYSTKKAAEKAKDKQ